MSGFFLKSIANVMQQIPTRCVVCDSPDASQNLCEWCQQDLPQADAACHLCALPSGVIESDVCGPCLLNPPPWTHAIATLPYTEPINVLLHKLKYHADFASGRVLGNIMAHVVAKHVHSPPDVIVPLPLHWIRLWRRGFNQASQLALPIARHTHIKIDASSCTRTRNTPRQATLDYQQRKANVKNAFRVKRKFIAGLSVALVDDVMTTGATARAACQALLDAGAAEVQVWVCARVVLSRSATGIN